jgi:feruloyl esterase
MRRSVVWLALALAAGQGERAADSAHALAHTQTAVGRCTMTAFDGVSIDGTVVRSVTAVSAGNPPASGPGAPVATPDHCRVEATVTTSPDSLVNFEVWVPQGWNGKIVVTGNGGYSNAINRRDMAHALSQRYTAVGGDTGHQTPTPDDLLWGVGHPERIIDWGTRSIHAITAPARRIVERVQGSSPRRAYFYGCSTGGHQAYAEIQRYPEDFDGVIAGAPGNNRVRLNAGFLWQFLSNRQPGDNGAPIIPASTLPLITRAVVAACDAGDGVSDGVVDDPRACRFDPGVLQCSGDRTDCLTPVQVAALRKMYQGAKNLRTGAQVYPGWPVSSEALTVSPQGSPQSGWHQYWGNTEPTRAAFWRHWVFADPKWDWWSFDFDRHLAIADERVGRMIDHVNPDISAFRARGGKAIVYQGWQDPVVNALDTIAYYERVRTRRGSQQDVDRFVRLFLVPGMGHCAGGTGTTNFGNQNAPSPVVDAEHDLLSALDAWVEKGTAPSRIVASRVVNGATVRTRPLCSYPLNAVYRGGSVDDAASFECRVGSVRVSPMPR